MNRKKVRNEVLNGLWTKASLQYSTFDVGLRMMDEFANPFQVQSEIIANIGGETGAFELRTMEWRISNALYCDIYNQHHTQTIRNLRSNVHRIMAFNDCDEIYFNFADAVEETLRMTWK